MKQGDLQVEKIKIEDIIKTITYLIGLIGCLSVFKHISIVYSSIFVTLYLSAIYFDFRTNFHMSRWALNLAALTVILLSLFRLDLNNLVVPAVEGLLILMGIKFLEEKRFRDYMQIYLISLFLLSGAALLSIDIEFLVYFLIQIFLLTISIVLLAYYSQEPDMVLPKYTILKIVMKSSLIPLIAIPATIFLFAALPRTSHPFFNFLNMAERSKTGFTDNVRLGTVSAIQEDSTAMFRAHMERVDERHLYWRGIILDYFDGTSWQSTEGNIAHMSDRMGLKGERVRQTIYLEPYENRYLFALDKPYLITVKDIKKHSDLTFSLPKEINRRLKYEVVSVMSEIVPEEDIDKDMYLQLPENISYEITGLVRGLTSGKNREDGIRSVLNFLGSGVYRYSLQDIPVSTTPLQDFLFKYKQGNCEYFASAMAVMLRTAGIPARLVGGYIGGYYNDIGKYYMVPQKNAHVWVEAYIDKGWMRFDPTPASLEGFVSPKRQGIFFRIRLFADTINYYWNALVIGYDFEKQISLFQKIRSGIKSPEIKLSINKEKAVRYLIFSAGACAFALLFYIVIAGRKTEEEKLIILFLKKMERRGYKKTKSQGLEEFAAGIKEPNIRQSAYRFVEGFERSFYNDKKITKEEAKRLKNVLKSMVK